jgi:DNA-binding NtrC family response regulator
VPIAAATTHFGGVLVLDEDPGSAALVRSLLPASCPVATATTVEAAMALLEAQEYAVLVAELRHSSDDVIAALKLLKQASPRTLAVACSSLRDGRLLIDLINQGQVFRFLPKPLGKELLRRALLAALERHGELRHEPHRLRRHVVEAPRQVSLSGRVMDYLRRIRDQAKLRA